LIARRHLTSPAIRFPNPSHVLLKGTLMEYPMWILFLFACGEVAPVATTTPGHDAEAASTTEAPGEKPTLREKAPPDHRYSATLSLDGKTVSVHWDDGDTFTMKPEAGKEPVRARLSGYNTLESYGPVHRWGDWTSVELYRIAKAPGLTASGEEWSCTQLEGEGGYGRALVDCPELKLTLLRAGLAHNFLIDSTAEDRYLEAQQEAIAAKAGMWGKGVPEYLITSLHSQHERPSQPQTYDRMVSSTTGQSQKHVHSEVYSSCEEVCHHGSCMLYVPYEERHGSARAECLALPKAGD
jgi:micrococcal nuclease